MTTQPGGASRSFRHELGAAKPLCVCLRVTVVASFVLLGLGGTTAGGAGQPAREIVLYSHPLEAAVADPFRPPAHIGAPGNRGLEYANGDRAIVSAAAEGWVAYAGPVAGRKVVTIEHADGVRTTYTGFVEVWVTPGRYVWRHWAIGVASPGHHFGAKVNDHYLDPQILIDASEPSTHARLVAPPD